VGVAGGIWDRLTACSVCGGPISKDRLEGLMGKWILCENFEKCQDPYLECPHKYPHEDDDCDICDSMECDQVDRKVECLEIILKRKGEEDGKLTNSV